MDSQEEPLPIRLRGVRVHNLKSIDLDLPSRRLIVFCGLSGSGKSSLAIDTLYAEGQRRYIETFSASARQFLDQLDKPEADKIEGIPPAIAVTGSSAGSSRRSSVGTATEIQDYLQLLFANIGRVFCTECGREVRPESSESVVERLESLPDGVRYMLAYPWIFDEDESLEDALRRIQELGFRRVRINDKLLTLDDLSNESSTYELDQIREQGLDVVVDRLSAGRATRERLTDSVESALGHGRGKIVLLIENQNDKAGQGGASLGIGGRLWRRLLLSTSPFCGVCGIEYPTPDPRLFNSNSPLGACPTCEGFGNIVQVDMDLVVPDRTKSIRDGAIACWRTPAYKKELDRLLEVASACEICVDIPFHDMKDVETERLRRGDPDAGFPGLDEFFSALEQRKYKMHVRVFLSRWRSYRDCPDCGGARLRPESLAFHVGGKNIAELAALEVRELVPFFQDIKLTDAEQEKSRLVLDQIRSRLDYLTDAGLGYVALDRGMGTLSAGERRRVMLTSALGSSLVNMLYVLDEPTVGLHPRDTDRLLGAVQRLRDRDNTVVVTDHEEAFLRAADHLVEIGPGAGAEGGHVVFAGPASEIVNEPKSVTGDYLAGRRGVSSSAQRRPIEHGVIRLEGARGNNLKNLTVDFPLGMLCLVTGVSGAGKSTLVTETLAPAIGRALGQETAKPLPFDRLSGACQIEDVVMIDQSPIGRSPRSNPVTYLKAFDEIRQVFSTTLEAKTRNYPASHFSFNVDGGRCNECKGEGFIQIDMHFLSDVFMKCPQCRGKRYQQEILEVLYRGRNIAEVLDMTVREAFHFFRGRRKVQKKLKRLLDVGLDYIRLGQPANTMSGGELQRLKLAAYMSNISSGRRLILLDEPTTGLHFSDVVQLIDCFDALLEVGHSLIVIEHNPQLLKAADYIIDLGPDAADRGGEIVVQGTPEEVAACAKSVTGRYLAESLHRFEE